LVLVIYFMTMRFSYFCTSATIMIDAFSLFIFEHSSAHACSEIGLKWFLFALYDLGTALGFVSVLDLFGYFVFLKHGGNWQNGIKTIFDHFRNTHAR